MVLHFLGVIDLSFIGVAFLALQVWSASAVVNAFLLDIGLIAFGMFIWWVLMTYFIGVKTTIQPQQQPGYAPIPAYPSQTQKDTETVIT